MSSSIDLDTGQIRKWRSIITLIVFVLTNIVVLFPFNISIPIPKRLWNSISYFFRKLRITSPERDSLRDGDERTEPAAFRNGFLAKYFKPLRFPMDFVTAPLIAVLFLLAISAVGRTEVRDGTVGANNIFPIDIMAFFITLAYIAISIDASGLIRYLAFKVLQKGGGNGHRLFLYLYAFFFALASFIGNDPVILSGTAFLAYMTRVSSNIKNPRAWIFTQFAAANIGSAILVSSNPTNLVLAGAFTIKFIDYTANIIVPVLVAAIVLFPFLLYINFPSDDDSLIPVSIKLHELPESAKNNKPVNPNIPHARGKAEEEEENAADDEQGQLLSLEEIMNPFVDKGGAAFGAFIMAVTLITILALNAATDTTKEHPVYWVTLPAAFIMLCWDVSSGWLHRKQTREIAHRGRQEFEAARAARLEEAARQADEAGSGEPEEAQDTAQPLSLAAQKSITPLSGTTFASDQLPQALSNAPTDVEIDEKVPPKEDFDKPSARGQRSTLVSLLADGYRWSQETFPTVTAVIGHLPFKLVPFALCMFVLVQALVTKGWVPVFAYGWDHWVDKTGTVGAIGGMAFLSVIMCNFAGTNIGTTILLCRVIQAWVEIHSRNGTPISQRTFWATVYSMALGVNFGAFSAAFSASLAGLLWRDILARKHIHVKQTDFARVNILIIAVSMIVGCAVLVGEVYIMRSTAPYGPS